MRSNICFAYDELTSYIGISGQLVGAISLGYADEKDLQMFELCIGNSQKAELGKADRRKSIAYIKSRKADCHSVYYI